jgi:predicted transcriptional regulator
MLTITVDDKLAERLRRAARDLGKDAQSVALTAIEVFVEDCEEARRNRARFGVPEGQRMMVDFTD